LERSDSEKLDVTGETSIRDTKRRSDGIDTNKAFVALRSSNAEDWRAIEIAGESRFSGTRLRSLIEWT
ncbi:MAG: hypothetical protein WBM45_04550, partial [Woeseiaceae bacterium]